MALPSWAADTVIRVRPTTRTVRGSDVLDWDNPDRLEIKGCSVQPSGTSLSQDGRVLGVEDRFTAYLPPESDVLAGDHIIWNDGEYTINGDPQSWKSPTGRVSSMQISLERWRG